MREQTGNTGVAASHILPTAPPKTLDIPVCPVYHTYHMRGVNESLGGSSSKLNNRSLEAS